MKKEAIAKAAITRKMNLLTGPRPPLPGQNPAREAMLRGELAESFKPANVAEMIWVADIARCLLTMAVIEAQAAGFRMRQIKEAYDGIKGQENLEAFAVSDLRHIMSATSECAELEPYVEDDFVPPPGDTFLDEPAFLGLLGRVEQRASEQMRLFQRALHDEAKERDRLINQIDRRRRQAMRDAIAMAEERRRAAIFARAMGQPGAEADQEIAAAAAIIMAGSGDHHAIAPGSDDEEGGPDSGPGLIYDDGLSAPCSTPLLPGSAE